MKQPFISESELMRLANVPATRFRKLKSKGRLSPDFVIGRTHAFRTERLPELINALRD
jgi:hypothetical protein